MTSPNLCHCFCSIQPDLQGGFKAVSLHASKDDGHPTTFMIKRRKKSMANRKVEPKVQHQHNVSRVQHDNVTSVMPSVMTAAVNSTQNYPEEHRVVVHHAKKSEPNQFDDSIDLSPKPEYNPVDSSTWPWDFTYERSAKPYLVICHKFDDWIYPISQHFKILRIIDGDLPPWNATALLLHEDVFCENHTYVKEAVRRRGLARYLDESSRVDWMSGWNDGVFWPGAATLQSTNALRSIVNRPALVRVQGEVFWRNKGDSCSDVDFVVDRQTERVFDDCFTIHYIQGMASAYLREHSEDKLNGGLNVEETFDLYTKKVVHPKANPDIPFPYSKFCSFLIRFDPNDLVGMFNSSRYDIDAIVRHMFFRQLSEYKSCDRVMDCGGNPYNSYKCLSGYKFHITMENSHVSGYVSEKIFMGALGSGIPIYFGTYDVVTYANEDSFIYCNVSRSVLDEMRSFYPRVKRPRPFLFARASTGFFPTEEELYNWADSYLRLQLEPCVDRVIQLDNNETLFRQVVSEPFITNLDVLNGLYPFKGIELALAALKH